MSGLVSVTEKVLTADGVTLSLTRTGPQTGQSGVLLLHGLTANRLSFDLDPTRSFALECANYFPVFNLELRGHGHSQVPRPKNWSVDSYIHLDLPAAIDHILASGQVKRLHAVGHSMGGIILLAWLASQNRTALGPTLKSVTTIGSSLYYRDTGSLHQELLRFRGLARFLPFLPLGVIKRFIAPAIGRLERGFEDFYYHPPNIDKKARQKLFREGFHGVPIPVLLQLTTLFEEGGFTSWPGGIPYGPGLMNSITPVHSVFGALDKQCPPLASQALRQAMGDVPFYESVIPGYGHFDLLLGDQAARDVFPRLTEWILAQDRA